uniref:Fork-head domain-containing protein n=1 Tax=Mizuhopecten yessoensis TaxID=6573 RepID=A0A5P8N755_MIZYE|nr:hypothetical protein [Mizuhopecten yessoensis]
MENVRQSLLENIHNLQLPNRNKAIYKRYGKPPYSYAGMIIVAIMTSPNKMLSLSEIHDYLRNMFDFFKQPYLGWKDSVRHNLSHCKCFVKGGKTADGRNNLWTVNMAEVTPSLFRRQQTAIAKDGNYAEDLHDELQVPRIDIPFFNYSRGAPSKTTSDRPSSSVFVIGATDYSCDTNEGNHGYQQTSAPYTAGSATDCHSTNNCRPQTPMLYRLPSVTSANSPIVLGSPDKGKTTIVRPPSVLSTSSSSTSLRSLGEHPGQSSSPAFSDITEPRTPDMADNDMSGFRPINDDVQSGWITPLGLLRDSSDMTRGASCLSDVSPSRSECSSSRRAPKRKQIRHRPKVRKAMRTDNFRTSRADSTFSEMTYADLQSLVTQSASQWEVSVDNAIGNLHVLCKSNTEAPVHVVATNTEYSLPTPSFVTGIQTPEVGNQPYTGYDQQTTFSTGNGITYIQTEDRTVEQATPTHDFHIPGPHRIDHTYSSPERVNNSIPETKQQTSDVTWEIGNEPTTSIGDDTNSLEEFANCALWYGLLS